MKRIIIICMCLVTALAASAQSSSGKVNTKDEYFIKTTTVVDSVKAKGILDTLYEKLEFETYYEELLLIHLYDLQSKKNESVENPIAIELLHDIFDFHIIRPEGLDKSVKRKDYGRAIADFLLTPDEEPFVTTYVGKPKKDYKNNFVSESICHYIDAYIRKITKLKEVVFKDRMLKDMRAKKPFSSFKYAFDAAGYSIPMMEVTDTIKNPNYRPPVIIDPADYKTYSGPYEYGTATYTYVDNPEGGRIYDGKFVFKANGGTITGSFKNDKKDGLWIYEDGHSILRVEYSEGEYGGDYVYEGTVGGFLQSLKCTIKDGYFVGKIQAKGIGLSWKDKTISSEFASVLVNLDGQFDMEGKYTGKWTFKSAESGNYKTYYAKYSDDGKSKKLYKEDPTTGDVIKGFKGFIMGSVMRIMRANRTYFEDVIKRGSPSGFVDDIVNSSDKSVVIW